MNVLMTIILTVMAILTLGGVMASRRAKPATVLRTVVGGMMGLDILAVLACLAMALLSLASPMPVLAEEAEAASAAGASTAPLGAALATGLACIGAGIAVAGAGAAALGSITEKPEILGRTLIFVGLAEGIAIYGLIISFMIMGG